jgi:hypothetical protein
VGRCKMPQTICGARVQDQDSILVLLPQHVHRGRRPRSHPVPTPSKAHVQCEEKPYPDVFNNILGERTCSLWRDGDMAAALYVPVATEPYDQPAARRAARAAVAAAAAQEAGASSCGGDVHVFDRGTAASIGTTPMLVGQLCGVFGGSLASYFVAMVVVSWWCPRQLLHCHVRQLFLTRSLCCPQA